MKKNGFTLIEVLAVLVILSIIMSIGAISVINIRNNSYKDLLETKKQNLEAAAIVYGQENPDVLKDKCEIDNYKSDYCAMVTVATLINANGEIDLINNVTNKSMKNDKIQIYRKNNSIYAKYLENNVSES